MKTEIGMLFASAALSAVLCALLIPLLRRYNARQYILGYVEEHKYKGGTPTMGGISFMLAVLVCAFAFGLFSDRRAAVAVTLALACAAVGLLDDFLKLRLRRNLGLRAYQKIVFQVCIALVAGVYCFRNDLTVLHIPFTHLSFDVGAWMIPLVAFAFIASANCVNLTDGLDGLAASVSFWYFAALAALIFFLSGNGDASLSGLCLLLCGALAGYLLFNTYRASVFMGDTGSLGLGGFVASVSAFSGNLLYIAVVGIMFVCSGVSVILQVLHFKRTKKRLFLMAPLHHHFQKKGFAESKIVCAYSFATAAAGLVCLLFVQ